MTHKIVYINQSNYIPWRGFFQNIAKADEYIIGDDVEYSKGDWRNRNMIKCPDGTKWLTIPVFYKTNSKKRIFDIEIADNKIFAKHYHTILANYNKAPCYLEIKPLLAKIYEEIKTLKLLSQVNLYILRELLNILSIDTKISLSTDYFTQAKLSDFSRNERLIQLMHKTQATKYLSGQKAKSYLDEDLFKQSNLEIVWADHDNLEIYPQLYGKFNNYVSVIDILMMVGVERAKEYIIPNS